MHLPNLEFRYSWIYDEHYKTVWEQQKKRQLYPSSQTIKAFMKKAEKTWNKHSKHILTECSRVMELPWNEKRIICDGDGCNGDQGGCDSDASCG